MGFDGSAGAFAAVGLVVVAVIAVIITIINIITMFSHYHPLIPTLYLVWEGTERDGQQNSPGGFLPAQGERAQVSADLDTRGGHLCGPVAELEAVPCWGQGVVTHQGRAGRSLQLQGIEAGAPAGAAEDAVSPRPALGSWGACKRARRNELIGLIPPDGVNSCLNPISFRVSICFRIGQIFKADKTQD